MKTRTAVSFMAIAVSIAQLAFQNVASGDDWPWWMGTGRANHWNETNIIDSFPEGGPKTIWRTEIAGGYSGPAVAEGRVFITDYVTSDNVKVSNFERKQFTGMERVHCLDEKTGEEIWKQEYPVKYSVSYPAGPRCTPIVDGDKVYTLGTEGDLYCFNVADGEIAWSKNLQKEYGAKAPLWGYAAHPLIDGDKLITLAGGEGSHVVALDKNTGEEKWKALTSKEQGYSPPTIIEAGGARQLILLRPNAVTSLNPKDGSKYWSVPYAASNGSIIMSPVKVGDYLYVAGFSDKSLLLKLDADKPGAKEVWRDKTKDAFSPVNVQPIAIGDVIFGFDQNGDFCALEIPSGKRLWETAKPVRERRQNSATAFIVKQSDRFWMFNENGELIIANLSRDGYKELDRVKVIEPTNNAMNRDVVWSMPAFANRHAYIRNDKEIICLDLAKQE